MADINQRSLWRKNPYWEQPKPSSTNVAGYANGGTVEPGYRGSGFINPYITPENMDYINQTYEDQGIAQLPQTQGVRTSPVVDLQQGANSQPLPVEFKAQGGQPNMFSSEFEPWNASNPPPQPVENINSGIGSMVNTGVDSAVETVEDVGSFARDRWYYAAKSLLENLGLPSTDDMVIERAKELKAKAAKEEGIASASVLDLDSLKGEPEIKDEYPTPDNEQTKFIPDAEYTGPRDQGNSTDGLDDTYKDFMDSVQRPDETFEKFAERIGVDLKDKPYSNWDYIRDMSAGLLASDEDSFLSALGDASVLSNKNRGKADDRAEDTRNSLAVAKWRSEDDWDQLEAKEKYGLRKEALKAKEKGLEIKTGPLLSSGKNPDGSTYEVHALNSDPSSVPSENLVWVNGKPALKSNTTDYKYLQERTYEHTSDYTKLVDDWVGSDISTDQMWQAGQGAEFNNELIIKYKDSDEGKALRRELMSSTEDAAQKLIDAIDNNDGQAADQWSRVLQNAGPAAAGLAKSYYTGLLAQMGPADLSAFKDEIRKRAIANFKENYNVNEPEAHSISKFLQPAIEEVVRGANYDEKGVLMFAKASPSQIKNARSNWDDLVGLDENNEFFNVAAFNFDEYPEGHPLSGALTTESPLNRPDELALINKNQYELLQPLDQQQLLKTRSELSANLQRNFNMSESQALFDINNSIMDSNTIYGGEDTLNIPFITSSENEMARLDLPKEYAHRPEIVYKDPNSGKIVSRVTNEQLQEKGIIWNGFKKEYYTFKKDPKTGKAIVDPETGMPIRLNVTNLFKRKGFSFGNSKVIPIE